jgi:tetratricopeptide (TPR) repeat protein
MTFLHNLLGTLVLRAAAIRALGEERAVFRGIVCFTVGFLTFALVRSAVYLSSLEPASVEAGLLSSFFHLNLLQAILFFAVIYIPAVILLGNSISGDGLGFYISKGEYQAHVSALLPLWGTIFLISAPFQWFFLVPWPELFGISLGLLVLVILMMVYSVWAIRELNFLSSAAALGVFVLSWFTLPVFYVLTAFLFALPLFILIPAIYLAFQRMRTHVDSRVGERNLQQHLHTLTLNPHDADAHHQLGLIHLKRRNLEAAQRYFSAAMKIDPKDPDYHYFLGRVLELKGDWPRALECYEETYRINPEYGLGDIFREVGKAYLHAGRLEKAIEFLKFFLESRGSDPEGRYWLAVALQKTGNPENMKAQLNTILEQARSNPRFFRRENREWLYRARMLLRQH